MNSQRISKLCRRLCRNLCRKTAEPGKGYDKAFPARVIWGMICLPMITATALLAGCGEKSAPSGHPPTTSTSETTPANAPAGYLGAMGKAQQSAVKTVDTTSVNQAIQLFNVDQGRNPKDLNELVEKKYLPLVPTPPPGTKLEYDANAGTVKIVKQ